MHIFMDTQRLFKLKVNVSIYVCLSTNSRLMSIPLIDISYLRNLKTPHILKIFSIGSSTEDTITSKYSEVRK